MPAHGFPPRSHDRATKHASRNTRTPRSRNGIVPLIWAALLLLCLAATFWWGVGLSWNAMTRDDGGSTHARWTLVLDGWVPDGERVAKGLSLARSRQTDSVLVSGSQIAPGFWASTLQVRAQRLDPQLVGRVAELRHGAHSTQEEAQAATAFFRSRHVDTVLLVTSDYHTDRASSIFKRIASGHPVYLAVPALEARFSGRWDRERMKTWLLEATKRIHWKLLERWLVSPLDPGARTSIPWKAVMGDSVGISPLLQAAGPTAPTCPPPVRCPVCPVAEPVVAPCPETKSVKTAKVEPKATVKEPASKATKSDTKKSSTKAKEPAKKSGPQKKR